MKAAAFFISLILLVTGLNNCVSAAMFPRHSQSAASHHGHVSGVDRQQRQNTLFKVGAEAAIKTLLICEEPDDEDNSDYSSRKQRVLANILLSVLFQSSVADLACPSTTSAPYPAHTSCRYILLRTLRI